MGTTVGKIIAVAGRDQLPKYGALAALMLIAALLEALGIGAVIPLLGAVSQPETVLANEPVRRLLQAFGAAIDAQRLVLLAGATMILVFALKGALLLVSTWLQGKILHEQRAKLSRVLFSHYLHLPYGLFLGKNVAHLMHVVAGVSTNFATVFMASVMALVAEILVCLTIVGLLVLVSPTVTGIAAAFMLVVGGAYVGWSRRGLASTGREQHAAALGLNKSMMEGLGSLKETRVLGAEEYFLRKFDDLAQRYMRHSARLYIFNHAPRLVAETLFVLIVVGAVMALSAAGRDLKPDLPLMALFGMAFLRLLPCFNRMLVAFTGARVHLVALNTLFTELDETRRLAPAPVAAAGAMPALKLERALQLEGVSYSYPDQPSRALHGVSLEIRRGETVGLVGKSGAGKTTLVDVILGLLQPQEGAVLCDGAPIAGRQHEWRGLVGYIPQSIYLTDDSIRRNIAFGIEDRDIDEHAVRRALTAAQLEEFVGSLPAGLDTVVGDRGVRLSGGQRQRIGIARALYRDPQLLVLDEATSALDAETESGVNEAIRQLGKSKTLIIIAHRHTTVRNCGRLYLIDEGRIADAGAYDELASRNARFRAGNEILA